MTTSSARRERGRWSRSLVLVGLLAAGTACGRSGEAGSADLHQGTSTERPTEAPSPLGTAPGPEVAAVLAGRQPAQSVSPPPPPELGTKRPQAPPTTMRLETLHEQGRTHVLR